MALGRWGEARLVDTVLDTIDEVPTIHLGIDLFAPAGTRGPCAGRRRGAA